MKKSLKGGLALGKARECVVQRVYSCELHKAAGPQHWRAIATSFHIVNARLLSGTCKARRTLRRSLRASSTFGSIVAIGSGSPSRLMKLHALRDRLFMLFPQHASQCRSRPVSYAPGVPMRPQCLCCCQNAFSKFDAEDAWCHFHGGVSRPLASAGHGINDTGYQRTRFPFW